MPAYPPIAIDTSLLAPVASPTFTGVATAPSVSASGKAGATNQATILAGGTASGAPSTGAHVVGEFVVDATGGAWYCTVAGTPGTWVQIGSRTLLAVTAYAPAVGVSFNRATASFADVDATNLAVTFTAPASGSVNVDLMATTNSGGGTPTNWWGLREATTDLPNAGRYQNLGSSALSRIVIPVPVTGLTPGSVHTYKWSFRGFGGADATYIYAGAGISTIEGPAVMRVWSA